MSRLLVVHHTPSPTLQAMLEAVLEGARHPDLAGVEVVTRPALTAGAADLLAADAVVLGTPANIGYMSGALKHFFDGVYYPTLLELKGLPFGYYVHGASDLSGAERSITKVTDALGWRQAAAPVLATGALDAPTRGACSDLGATVAAALL